LAQRPRLLVLDELTNHLDIRARFELLDLVRATGITTLAVLHDLDLDLAARLCDRLVVLNEGAVAAAGTVLDVLTPAVFREVFGVRASAARHEDGVIRLAYGAQPLSFGGDFGGDGEREPAGEPASDLAPGSEPDPDRIPEPASDLAPDLAPEPVADRG